jgi:hypothetical protein
VKGGRPMAAAAGRVHHRSSDGQMPAVTAHRQNMTSSAVRLPCSFLRWGGGGGSRMWCGCRCKQAVAAIAPVRAGVAGRSHLPKPPGAAPVVEARRVDRAQLVQHVAHVGEGGLLHQHLPAVAGLTHGWRDLGGRGQRRGGGFGAGRGAGPPAHPAPRLAGRGACLRLRLHWPPAPLASSKTALFLISVPSGTTPVATPILRRGARAAWKGASGHALCMVTQGLLPAAPLRPPPRGRVSLPAPTPT